MDTKISLKNAFILVGLIQAAIEEEIENNGFVSKYSQIGKRTTVNENSYNKCLSNPAPIGRYAHYNLINGEFVIISEPYIKQVHEGSDLRLFGERYCNMVKVFSPSDGKVYEINFQEGWLLD